MEQTDNGNQIKSEIVTVNINEIKPYWKNPRKNEEAVKPVMESIKAYGYQSPIVVDNDLVIISGETRYKAMKRLDFKEIRVVKANMNERQAREFRIIDNKTSEKAKWDHDVLTSELQAVDLSSFIPDFPELEIPDVDINFQGVSDDDLIKETDRKQNNVKELDDKRSDSTQMMTCPECLHEFEIK